MQTKDHYDITEEELQRIVARAVEIALDEIRRFEYDSNIQTALHRDSG